MENPTVTEKIRLLTEKYRYGFIVLLVGLGLMLIPNRAPSPSTQQVVPEPIPSDSLEENLEKTLANIDGAGRVDVLLTENSGSETSYQLDVDFSSQSDASERAENTVILEDSDRKQSGLIKRIDPPKYRGAVIVCQGADSPQIRLAIVEAVRCVTCLRSDQISVVKMK